MRERQAAGVSGVAGEGGLEGLAGGGGIAGLELGLGELEVQLGGGVAALGGLSQLRGGVAVAAEGAAGIGFLDQDFSRDLTGRISIGQGLQRGQGSLGAILPGIDVRDRELHLRIVRPQAQRPVKAGEGRFALAEGLLRLAAKGPRAGELRVRGDRSVGLLGGFRQLAAVQIHAAELHQPLGVVARQADRCFHVGDGLVLCAALPERLGVAVPGSLVGGALLDSRGKEGLGLVPLAALLRVEGLQRLPADGGQRGVARLRAAQRSAAGGELISSQPQRSKTQPREAVLVRAVRLRTGIRACLKWWLANSTVTLIGSYRQTPLRARRVFGQIVATRLRGVTKPSDSSK